MSEYIDADFATICDEWQPTVTSGEEQDFIKRDDAENIMLGSCDESALWKLRHLPSADVEPVRHGRWLDRTQEPGWPVAECSVCGSHAGMFWMRRCPNCGAKMDGKEQESE